MVGAHDSKITFIDDANVQGNVSSSPGIPIPKSFRLLIRMQTKLGEILSPSPALPAAKLSAG